MGLEQGESCFRLKRTLAQERTSKMRTDGWEKAGMRLLMTKTSQAEESVKTNSFSPGYPTFNTFLINM